MRRTLLPRYALATLLVVFCVAAKNRAVTHPAIPFEPPPRDIFSVAEPAAVRTWHLSLDLTVDFDARRIVGTAVHHIANTARTNRLLLDTRDLEILAVFVDENPATWRLGDATPLGRALTIDIEPSTRTVRIDYIASSVEAGLHWRTALQTRGDVAPFLFTHSQPDRTRNWIPIQDTPAVRMTYDATVRVPRGLLALMTAPNPAVANDTGVYTFRMNQTLPPYLIALAVGRLELRALDERTGIYAEPEMLDDAGWDMQFVPELVDAAERLLGPYPYPRYDLLFPPGFVAGGMENPMLNFISTGLISGNREPDPPPQGFVSHELAHAWGGDLVTCATWSDTWLNEGFATYYDKRFVEEMGHADQAELIYMFERSSFASYVTPRTLPDTVLHHKFIAGETAHSTFDTTSYQKGMLFLKMLEDRIGRDGFDAFIREYLRRRAYNWTDDLAFVDALEDVVLDARPELAPILRVDEWIYGKGLPSNVTAPTSSRALDRVSVQANRFRAGASIESLDRAGWTPFEHSLFIGQITDVMVNRMPELDAAFGFSSMATPPTNWLAATAKTFYAPSMPALERYLERGDPNMLAVYSELVKTAAGRTWALELYKRLRDHYAPQYQSYLDSLFKLSNARPAA